VNILGGKEWTMRKKNIFALNLKTTFAGGKRFIPIDVAASTIAGETKFDYYHAYEDQLKNYFRTDLKISYRVNKKKSTHEYSIDIDNIFNTKNIWSQTFDPKSQKVKTQYQLGIFPVPQFRLTF
jgi:outer membrane receptor protein involved in Fe transport